MFLFVISTIVTIAHTYKRDKMIDKNHWMAYWYQIKEILDCDPRNVLIIGKGEGVVDEYLKSCNINIKSIDIDPKCNPDIVGDVKDLNKIFKKNKFDVVLCAEVLEHLPFNSFSSCLKQIASISQKYAIITLPFNGMMFSFGFDFPLFHDIWLNIPLIHKKKLNGDHCWEIDSDKNCSLKMIRNLLQSYFKIKNEYWYPRFPYIHLFKLEVKNEG